MEEERRIRSRRKSSWEVSVSSGRGKNSSSSSSPSSFPTSIKSSSIKEINPPSSSSQLLALHHLLYLTLLCPSHRDYRMQLLVLVFNLIRLVLTIDAPLVVAGSSPESLSSPKKSHLLGLRLPFVVSVGESASTSIRSGFHLLLPLSTSASPSSSDQGLKATMTEGGRNDDFPTSIPDRTSLPPLLRHQYRDNVGVGRQVWFECKTRVFSTKDNGRAKAKNQNQNEQDWNFVTFDEAICALSLLFRPFLRRQRRLSGGVDQSSSQAVDGEEVEECDRGVDGEMRVETGLVITVEDVDRQQQRGVHRPEESTKEDGGEDEDEEDDFILRVPRMVVPDGWEPPVLPIYELETEGLNDSHLRLLEEESYVHALRGTPDGIETQRKIPTWDEDLARFNDLLRNGSGSRPSNTIVPTVQMVQAPGKPPNSPPAIPRTFSQPSLIIFRPPLFPHQPHPHPTSAIPSIFRPSLPSLDILAKVNFVSGAGFGVSKVRKGKSRFLLSLGITRIVEKGLVLALGGEEGTGGAVPPPLPTSVSVSRSISASAFYNEVGLSVLAGVRSGFKSYQCLPLLRRLFGVLLLPSPLHPPQTQRRIQAHIYHSVPRWL
ncbi:hypothetical protein BYT27DRAFT_7255124 [Phlegmacium glaucopus]|nr:hypothetical protein BYT27DRAFT_7255124 [Phlegmacium glaucopus]